MEERKAREAMQEGLSNGNHPSENKANGSHGTRDTQGLQSAMEMLLESYGVPREQSVAWLGNSGIDALQSRVASELSDVNGSITPNGAAAASAVLSENAHIILKQRYLMKGDDGEPTEDPDGLFHRVSNAVAQGEKPEARHLWAGRFYDLMTSLKFLPNSPTLVNAGTGGRGCLSACFVVSPEDNMTSIMQVASDAAMIEKWGGGIGFGFSKLRPRRDRIATTHGEACGPIAVMKLYSSVGATLTQGAFRLGAHMGQLNIRHPDVQEFIHCKDNDDTLQNFNISVQITDEFMRAVEQRRGLDILQPARYGRRACERGCRHSSGARPMARNLRVGVENGRPRRGVHGSRVWDTQPNPQMGDIQTSNPCGEEFLENYGNCCLGSINLDKHVRARTGSTMNGLGNTVRTAVRFLDDVIEVNQFPMQKLRDVNLATRRIGLGVMGWADALIRTGHSLMIRRARWNLQRQVAGFIHDTAWDESARLGIRARTVP